MDTKSSVTRLNEKVTHEIMEPYLSGDMLTYHEESITTNTWRCNACGLIWAKKWYAETCASRNHKTSFDQVYHYRPEGFLTHGRYAETRYTRYALGRDKSGAPSN